MLSIINVMSLESYQKLRAKNESSFEYILLVLPWFDGFEPKSNKITKVLLKFDTDLIMLIFLARYLFLNLFPIEEF